MLSIRSGRMEQTMASPFLLSNQTDLVDLADMENPIRGEALAFSWNGEINATRFALDTLYARRPRRLISIPRT